VKKKLKIIVLALLFPVLIASSRLVPLPSTPKNFSQIAPIASDSINYTIGVFPDEEYTWIITALREENLELVFGSNWADVFGLFGVPQIGYKFKTNVTSTQSNGTHYLLDFAGWDCLYRLTNFSIASDRSCRYEYPIKPQNYTDSFEFNCLFPLFLPIPVVPYVFATNLTATYYDAGDYTSYGGGLYVYYHRQITIGESTINLEGIASYLENGALDYFQFFYNNGTENFDCLTIESFKPYHLERTSMVCQVGEEFTWILVNYNLSVLEYFFGDDFFKMYGLLENPERMQSVKMKVEAVSENSTHWLVDYSLYNWTSLEDDFPESSVQNNSYEFAKEPFNESRSGDASIPFLIPEPTELYLRHGRLGDSYVAYYDLYSCVSFSVRKGEETMWGSAFYNRAGVLTTMKFCRGVEIGGRYVEQVAFEIALYYDSIIPDYVGIEEGAQLNYDIYTNYTLEPYIPFSTKHYESAKIEVIKIFGEEVVSNRTLFVANFSLKRDNGVWDLENELIVGYIHGDNNMYFDPLVISSVSPFYLAPLFANNRMNWTEFAFSYNNYNGIMNSDYYAANELQNGFELHYRDYQKNITFSHKYNETGFLSEYTIYYNDVLYHNCSVGEVFPPPIVIDTNPPVITVINPSLDDMFGTNPPEYYVTVEEVLRNFTISKVRMLNSQNISIENCFIGKLRAIRCRNLAFRNNSIVNARQLLCRSFSFRK